MAGSWFRKIFTGRFTVLPLDLATTRNRRNISQNNMSKTYYAEINLHITWHTKNNSRLITPELRPLLYGFLKDRIVNTEGAYFHGIGGIADHLHIGASVAPKIHLDEWFGQLKGASSHEFGSALSWQRGYGVVSFGTRDLPWVLEYINNQPERHRKGDISPRLERIDPE